jgi:hypothetical protein
VIVVVPKRKLVFVRPSSVDGGVVGAVGAVDVAAAARISRAYSLRWTKA